MHNPNDGKQSRILTDIEATLGRLARQDQFLEVVDRDEAIARFHRHLKMRPLASEQVPLAQSLNRVLAKSVVAEVDVPGFDRASVDGFAVRAGDTMNASEQAPRILQLNAEVLTPGVEPRLAVTQGSATLIATGGMVPRGADAIVMVEYTETLAADAKTKIRRPSVPGDHRHQVRPDPVRAAGLAGAGHRGLADPVGELPVHRTGADRRPGPPDARRRVLDVQLLPRGLADRPAGRHRAGRVRPHPVRRPARRRAGRGHARRWTSRSSPAATAYAPAGAVIAPATDDRPFLYYQGGSIPAIYLWTLAGILLISLIAVRILGGPFRAMRPYADLFFMGAAFLLLETKNIATFALLFGTTWVVNALVFAGVLVIVLAAVETTRRFRTPPLPRGVRRYRGRRWPVCYFVEPDWLLTCRSSRG